MPSSSPFIHLPTGPPPQDRILKIFHAYMADPNPDKVVLAIGAYRTDEGKNYVLPSVRIAEQRILSGNVDYEYGMSLVSDL